MVQEPNKTIEMPDFEEESFWDKVWSVAKSAGKEVIGVALTMYYALIDEDTPTWARAVIVGALIYFVNPVDAIPDVIPGVGYSDDLAVLFAALATVAAHIKPEHRKRASEWVERNIA